MRYIAILTFLALPLLPVSAAADSKPEEVRAEEFKCERGEQQSREAYVSVTFRQEAVRDASNPRVFRPGKLSLSKLAVLYCHDGKKGGAEQAQLESSVPLVKAFLVDVPAKSKKTSFKDAYGHKQSAFLGLRAKLLGAEPGANDACGPSDCRSYYHNGPPNEHYMEAREVLYSEQCQPLVKAYARGLAQGELNKRLPGKTVGDFLEGHRHCQESMIGDPASGKLTFEVHVHATMPLTD